MTSQQPEQLLFHYTSAAGALGILHSDTLRASMVQYMNDGQELTYALELAREMVLKGAGESNVKAITEQFLGIMGGLTVYAFSLSEESDLLSQWRAYCPSEGGFALGFSAAELIALGEPKGFQLVRCEYKPDAQRQLLRPVIDDLLKIARKAVTKGSVSVLTISYRLGLACASIKHPSFEEEKEWRLIAAQVPGESIRFRAARSLVVPYCELPIGGGSTFPVKRVVVGPHRHADLAERSLHLLTSTTHGWPVHVLRTRTPFRIID